MDKSLLSIGSKVLILYWCGSTCKERIAKIAKVIVHTETPNLIDVYIPYRGYNLRIHKDNVLKILTEEEYETRRLLDQL